MKEGMDRREFLKYSMATGLIVAAGEMMKGGRHG